MSGIRLHLRRWLSVWACLLGGAGVVLPEAPAKKASLPAWWLRQAACIHRYEVYGHIGRPDEWTIVGGGAGGYQFTYSTWSSVGGRGRPQDASPAEQTYRAFLVWRRDGGSWREWTTARVCGLR